jgi:hypothetical protein
VTSGLCSVRASGSDGLPRKANPCDFRRGAGGRTGRRRPEGGRLDMIIVGTRPRNDCPFRRLPFAGPSGSGQRPAFDVVAGCTAALRTGGGVLFRSGQPGDEVLGWGPRSSRPGGLGRQFDMRAVRGRGARTVVTGGNNCRAFCRVAPCRTGANGRALRIEGAGPCIRPPMTWWTASFSS